MIALLFVFGSLLGAGSSALAYEPTVYPAIVKASAREPLGGSFEAGEKMLRAADPVEEANAAYYGGHAGYLRVCGFACTAVGVEGEAGADADGLKIPATSDTHSAKNKGYNDAAFEFAKKFNVQMHVRILADSGGAASALGAGVSAGATPGAAVGANCGSEPGAGACKPAEPAKPIAGSLSEKEMSVNGVTIGKSNLYNATGKFGTNMFKKEGDIFVICWKGDDGTTMAFESDKGGGPDQTITRALLLGASEEYAFAKDCKTSKKVSASALSLAGVRLGADVPSRAAPATEKTETSQVWKYETEKKSKKLANDLEVKTTPEGKVTSISVWKH